MKWKKSAMAVNLRLEPDAPLGRVLVELEIRLGDPVDDAGEAGERPFLVHGQAREPLQRLLEQDARLEPREVAAEAEVLGPAEPDVPVGRALRVECTRV